MVLFAMSTLRQATTSSMSRPNGNLAGYWDQVGFPVTTGGPYFINAAHQTLAADSGIARARSQLRSAIAALRIFFSRSNHPIVEIRRAGSGRDAARPQVVRTHVFVITLAWAAPLAWAPAADVATHDALMPLRHSHLWTWLKAHWRRDRSAGGRSVASARTQSLSSY